MPFDANTFMQQQMDEPLETEFRLVPIGEYQMTIDDFDDKAFQSYDFTYKSGPNKDLPGTLYNFNCPFVIHDDRVKSEMQRDKVVLRSTVRLDVDEKGQLEFGPNKNIELGRLRAAVGQEAKKPWGVTDLRGQGPFMGKVAHVEYETKDGRKGKRAEVQRVTRIV